MIWQKKFELGVERIDNQHKELFERVFDFLEVVRGDTNKEVRENRLRETLNFMSNYVHVHFKAEENLQKSCGYPDYEKHCRIHKDFTDEMDDFNKKYKNGEIEDDDIQKFSGRLLAWLINHVVREDQKIANHLDNNIIEEIKYDQNNRMEIIEKATKKTLSSMLQLEAEKIDKEGILLEDRVIGSVGIIGKVEGNIYFSFSKDFVLKIVKKMASMKVDKIDSFVKSAVGEVINITAADTVFKLNGGFDITPPDVYVGRDVEEILNENYDTVFIKTDLGEFKISSNIR